MKLSIAILFFVFFASFSLDAQTTGSVTVTVDAKGNPHAINQNIYGVGMFFDQGNPASTSSFIRQVNAPIHRIGGNLTSEYN